ncbi:helix-turn-helix domain-containing protein [Microbacterium sp. WHRI 7836]|uniref:helix-turn-helix domain-containing protein n=1 Tax=Microbacterium sp. WHRI 7836 TaxID=3162563 RepID=UPI00215DBFB4
MAIHSASSHPSTTAASTYLPQQPPTRRGANIATCGIAPERCAHAEAPHHPRIPRDHVPPPPLRRGSPSKCGDRSTLRTLRERSGLSREDVAYRSGLTRYTYQKYEKGESRPGSPANPTLRTLIAIAQVLAVSVHELIPDSPPDIRAR